MTPPELNAWCRRHGYSRSQAAHVLGYSKVHLIDMAYGRQAIRPSMGLTCACVDLLKDGGIDVIVRYPGFGELHGRIADIANWPKRGRPKRARANG